MAGFVIDEADGKCHPHEPHFRHHTPSIEGILLHFGYVTPNSDTPPHNQTRPMADARTEQASRHQLGTPNLIKKLSGLSHPRATCSIRCQEDFHDLPPFHFLPLGFHWGETLRIRPGICRRMSLWLRVQKSNMSKIKGESKKTNVSSWACTIHQEVQSRHIVIPLGTMRRVHG